MKSLTVSLLAIVALSSCAAGPNAQTGAVIGGLGGAAVGGIIGNQSGRGLEGAAIGAGVGALGGAAIGNAQDRRNYERQRQQQYYGDPNRGYYRNDGYYNDGRPGAYYPPAY